MENPPKGSTSTIVPPTVQRQRVKELAADENVSAGQLKEAAKTAGIATTSGGKALSDEKLRNAILDKSEGT